MKFLSILGIALFLFLACQSPTARDGTRSALSELSGLEEVSIVSKGLE